MLSMGHLILTKKPCVEDRSDKNISFYNTPLLTLLSPARLEYFSCIAPQTWSRSFLGRLSVFKGIMTLDIVLHLT